MGSLPREKSATKTEKDVILVVDDDECVRETLASRLGEAGYAVEAVETGEEAVEAVKRNAVTLVLMDLRLPGMDGVDLLRRLQRENSELLGIILTGYATVNQAVRAMKAGAFDFITKPFELDAVEVSIQRALEYRALKEENRRLQSAVREKYRFENLVGNSPAMSHVYELIEKVADTDSTIVILGESGTGKELVARTIHFNSARRDKPLIPVNCGAIPEHLLESELFGHERGAFTGAVASRIGRFERAHGGTVFLDEITEMSLALQVKLLRVLQERSFERVGGNRTINVDIRIIAATNKNLDHAVSNGQFRDDLYYRLNVIPIQIPPLRERILDLPLLVAYILARFRKGGWSAIEEIAAEAMTVLEKYPWPGNVRELENVLERVVTLKRRGTIDVEDLPTSIREGISPAVRPTPHNIQQASRSVFNSLPEDEMMTVWGRNGGGIDLARTVDEFETRLIMEALRRVNGVKSRAAQLLRMNRTTLVEKLKKRGMPDVIFDSNSSSS